MNNLRNLGIKFLLYAVLLGVLLPAIGRAPLGDALLTALVLAGVLYVGGDLLVLPYYGPLWAALADAGLAYVSLWSMDLVLARMGLPARWLFLPALVIAGAEFYFHRYLQAKEPVPQHKPPENPG